MMAGGKPRALQLAVAALAIAGCTTTNNQSADTSTASTQSTTSTTEVQRIEFVDEIGQQWIELPDPERASYDGERLTVARGTTLEIRGQECARPAMSISNPLAIISKSFAKFDDANVEVTDVRDLSIYIPPLMPPDVYFFSTTCRSSSDLGNPVSLGIEVTVVDAAELVEQPDLDDLPGEFCVFEPRDCDQPMTP